MKQSLILFLHLSYIKIKLFHLSWTFEHLSAHFTPVGTLEAQRAQVVAQ